VFLNKEKESKVTLWGRSGEGSVVVFYLSNGVGFLFLRFRGGGRVRTRNTLHIVGAAKSKIWHNAVERRKKIKEKNEKI